MLIFIYYILSYVYDYMCVVLLLFVTISTSYEICFCMDLWKVNKLNTEY
jgi:hypothetical protein